MVLASRIKEVRTNLDMTQKDFAESLGVSISALYSYETGRKTPNAEFIKELCEKYKVSADWLLGVEAIERIKSDADWLRTIVSLIDSGAAVEVVEINWPKELIKEDELIAGEDTILVFIEGYGLDASVYELMNLKNLVQKEVIDENVFKLWLDNEIQRLSDNEPLRGAYPTLLAKKTAERIEDN